MRANERTDERVAQYLRPYSCLFQTTVSCSQTHEESEKEQGDERPDDIIAIDDRNGGDHQKETAPSATISLREGKRKKRGRQDEDMDELEAKIMALEKLRAIRLKEQRGGEEGGSVGSGGDGAGDSGGNGGVSDVGTEGVGDSDDVKNNVNRESLADHIADSIFHSKVEEMLTRIEKRRKT